LCYPDPVLVSRQKQHQFVAEKDQLPSFVYTRGVLMGLPKEIADLVERFERNRESYKSGQYNEAQLRREFLDPLLEALGWDMTNRAGYAEAYKEVIHEDAIRIGNEIKAPDYCFRIGGTRIKPDRNDKANAILCTFKAHPHIACLA
jgi:hypothetical protein